MINIKDLPRDPSEALDQLLNELIAQSKGNAKVVDLRRQKHPTYNSILILSVAAIKTCSRIGNEEIGSEIASLLSLSDELTIEKYSERLEIAVALYYAYRLEDHFINCEDTENFEHVILSVGEKTKIQELMSKARECINKAENLGQSRRQRINHWITKIENELYKDVSNWGTFVAGAYEVIELVREGGAALGPAADAVVKMRTITQTKLKGQARLETDAKPKQIEDKSNN